MERERLKILPLIVAVCSGVKKIFDLSLEVCPIEGLCSKFPVIFSSLALIVHYK